jgi:PTH2 family peptidyl-tRNA hydrolase
MQGVVHMSVVHTKQVIVVRKDLNMRKGKIAAQVAHASLGVFSRHMQVQGRGNLFVGSFVFDEYAKLWFENSFTKICVSCDSEMELDKLADMCEALGITYNLVIDNGATEFNGVPTKTCLAVGPWKSEEIDQITGHLKLM